MPLDLVFSKPPSGSLIPKILNSFLPTCWKIRQNVAQEKGLLARRRQGTTEVKRKMGVIGLSASVPRERRTGCAGQQSLP